MVVLPASGEMIAKVFAYLSLQVMRHSPRIIAPYKQEPKAQTLVNASHCLSLVGLKFARDCIKNNNGINDAGVNERGKL